MFAARIPFSAARTLVCAALTCVVTFLVVPQTQPPSLHSAPDAQRHDAASLNQRLAGRMVREEAGVLPVTLRRMGAGPHAEEQLVLRASDSLAVRQAPGRNVKIAEDREGVQLKAGPALGADARRAAAHGRAL